MSDIKLENFPVPSIDKNGWPWDIQLSKFESMVSEEGSWPKISVITPSYNQGEYIEETIRSVLLQGYPNLEYIIIDGGSTDNTVEIIKKYEPWLSYWVSEKDEGQADAINKGFNIATGEVESYLNSDDLYLPGTLFKVAETFRNQQTKWVTAACNYFEDDIKNPISVNIPKQTSFKDYILLEQNNPQPSTFWLSSARKEVGFDKDYFFCIDFAFFCKLIDRYGFPEICDDTWSAFRKHSEAKSSRFKYTRLKEVEEITKKWSKNFSILTRLNFYNKIKLLHIKMDYLKLLDDNYKESGNIKKSDLLKKLLLYPPSLLNKQTRSAIKKIYFNY